MLDITAAMVTIDRSPVDNYLSDTLHGLVQSDLLTSTRLRELIVYDSEPDNWAKGVVSLNSDLRKVGVLTPCHTFVSNENVAEALRRSGQRSNQWVLFLEDDIAVCAEFFSSVGAWLDEYATDECKVFSFGASYQQIEQCIADGQGAWRYPVGAFYGTQCFAMRGADAVDLSAYLINHCYDRESNGTEYDLLMQDWAIECGEDNFLASCPSFVQHVGGQSVIRPRDNVHTFASWPGTAWSYTQQEVRHA